MSSCTGNGAGKVLSFPFFIASLARTGWYKAPAGNGV